MEELSLFPLMLICILSHVFNLSYAPLCLVFVAMITFYDSEFDKVFLLQAMLAKAETWELEKALRSSCNGMHYGKPSVSRLTREMFRHFKYTCQLQPPIATYRTKKEFVQKAAQQSHSKPQKDRIGPHFLQQSICCGSMTCHLMHLPLSSILSWKSNAFGKFW